MIGFLSVEIPRNAVRAEVMQAAKERSSRRRPHGQYQEAYDMRALGLSATLNVMHRWTHSHSLEVIGCDRMALSEIRCIVEKVINSNPSSLRLLRLDLTADVADLGMEFIRGHMLVKAKRTYRGFEKVEFEEGPRRLQTLYFGRGKDYIRVYDKMAQTVERGTPISRFSGSGHTSIVRFERQLRPPSRFAPLFADLNQCDQWCPFDQVRFPALVPVHDQAPLRAKIARAGIKAIIDEKGLLGARAYLHRESGGNAARLLRKYLTPKDHVAAPDLNLIFQESARRQLNEQI